MFRKILAPISILVLVSMLLTACGSAATPAAAPTSAAPAATTSAAAPATAPAATTSTSAAAAPATSATTAAPAAAADKPVSGGTVTYVRDQEPDKLVLQWTSMFVSFEVSRLVLDSLLVYNEKSEFVPELLKEVPTIENGGISKDGLTYTLRLRNDAKWQDGKPITAKDVVFTFGVINDPKNGASNPVAAKSVTAPDDYTVVLNLDAPNAGVLYRLTMVQPLPQHILKDVADWKTAEYLTKPYPGSGPFKFTEWQRGSFILVEKNPDYYRGTVYLDKIIDKIVPNVDARMTAMKTGEADLQFFLLGTVVDMARQMPGFKVTETASLYGTQFIMNPRVPQLQDLKVRQALNYAIDKEGIVKNVVKGLGKVKDSPIPASVPVYAKPKTIYTYDPAKAKAMLDEAGWKEPSPGSTRVAKGVPGVADGTKFAWTVLYTTGNAETQQICQVAQQQWKAVGAEVDLNGVDTAGFIAGMDGFKNGMGYAAMSVSPEPVEMGFWWKVKGARNWHGLDKLWPEIDDLFAKATVTLDQTERYKMIADYQEKIASLATDVFIYDRVLYDGVNVKLQNYKQLAVGTATWNAYEWWLKK